MNIYSSDDFWSIHKLSDVYRDNYSDVPIVKEVRDVELVALDDFEYGGINIFLKIDTQGNDAEVLLGASSTLKKTSVLHLELPFLNIYSEGNSVAEIFKITENAGFFPARFYPNSITPWGAWVDGDVIFVRRKAS